MNIRSAHPNPSVTPFLQERILFECDLADALYRVLLAKRSAMLLTMLAHNFVWPSLKMTLVAEA
jgi:hypothetical protein